MGTWTGQPVLMDKKVYAILETSDVNLVEYHRSDRQNEPPVWMAQVAGYGNRAAFHPPELCYVGDHFEVLERGPIALTINGRPWRVMRLVLSQAGRRSEAWYWFTANDRVTSNYYQQQVWLALQSIGSKPSSGMLVRVSTDQDDPARSRERLINFLSALDVARREQPDVSVDEPRSRNAS